MKERQQLVINRLPDENFGSDDLTGSKIRQREKKTIPILISRFIRKAGKVLEGINDVLPPYSR